MVFALTFIAPEVVGRIFGEERGRTGSMMAAGIARGHPRHPAGRLRVGGRPGRRAPHAAGGVRGPRRLADHTTIRVVLPAAVSGIVAAVILAASRAIGETMVVFIAGGAKRLGPA